MSEKLHIILNFFEKIGPAGMEAFLNGWKGTGDGVMKNPSFMRSQLHRNLNEQGLYKCVNYAHFSSDQFVGFRPELADAQWNKDMEKGKELEVQAYYAGFFEVATLDGKPIGPALPESESSVFMISCYEVSDGVDISSFEKAWQNLSGVSAASQRAQLYGLKNSGLYKRFTDHGKFLFVVRTELTGLTGNLPLGWELVETVRGIKLPDGVSGETSLYQVMPDCIIEK
ncbi:uncharacterized protein [Ptychodera flava]|uniref:uncharacterized protein n=1 Tax=Ptychodera flava TaxID=63121 RepID=UPI00396A6E16